MEIYKNRHELNDDPNTKPPESDLTDPEGARTFMDEPGKTVTVRLVNEKSSVDLSGRLSDIKQEVLGDMQVQVSFKTRNSIAHVFLVKT